MIKIRAPLVDANNKDFYDVDEKQFRVLINISGFSISFYQNSAESTRVDKTDYLELITTLNGVLRDKCSILTPYIIIEYSDVPDFNYAYIQKFNRYYFVGNPVSIRNNLWAIPMYVDVLMSHKDAIVQLNGMIERQENDYNEYLEDDMIQKYSYELEYHQPLSAWDGTETSIRFYYALGIVSEWFNPTDIPTYNFSIDSPWNNFYMCDYITFQTISSELIVGNILDDLKELFASKADYVHTTYISSLPIHKFEEDTAGYLSGNVNIADKISRTSTIKIGSSSISLPSGKYVYHCDSDCHFRIVYGEMHDGFAQPWAFSIERPTQSFMDYPPYMKVQIYLPYIGLVDIDSRITRNKKLYIVYDFDYSTGTCSALLIHFPFGDCFIPNSSDIRYRIPVTFLPEQVLYKWEGSYISEIPHGDSIGSKITRSVANIGLNIIGSGIQTATIATSIPENYSRGSLVSGRAGGQLAGNVLSSIANIHPIQASVNNNSSSSNKLFTNIYPTIIYHRPSTLPRDSAFRSQYGIPLHENRTLSSLTGFTKVESIHVENIPNAFNEELDDIESILLSGVIL